MQALELKGRKKLLDDQEIELQLKLKELLSHMAGPDGLHMQLQALKAAAHAPGRAAGHQVAPAQAPSVSAEQLEVIRGFVVHVRDHINGFIGPVKTAERDLAIMASESKEGKKREADSEWQSSRHPALPSPQQRFLLTN